MLRFLGSEGGKLVGSANKISRILQCYVINFSIKVGEGGMQWGPIFTSALRRMHLKLAVKSSFQIPFQIIT
jgi:hypothetical protein